MNKAYVCGRKYFQSIIDKEVQNITPENLEYKLPGINTEIGEGLILSYNNFTLPNGDFYVEIEKCINGKWLMEDDEVVEITDLSEYWLYKFIINRTIEVTSISDDEVVIPKSYFKKLLKNEYGVRGLVV